MSQRFNDKKFKKLERSWYEKLETKGFMDIENSSRNDRPLKSWHSREFLGRGREIEDTLEYLSMAGEVFDSGYKFKNSIHKKIWKHHCDGLSQREIAERISHLRGAVKHYRVWQIISEIKRDNGL